MSRSNSVGDLVPKDITEILALQANKKKRGSSLGRAFSWFKGSKRKRSLSNGSSRTGGPCGRTGESTTTKQINASAEHSKAGQKQDEQRKLSVHYTVSQHLQENVFIEGCRPQYLEDLHTEAQEGLKILQQEEHRNGLDLQDDQIMPEGDARSRDQDESFETDSTAGNSITSVSSVSALSSRPVLTRQGSTFKPLNPVKRLDRTRRRSRRTTIMGIPQQVQKELDMARRPILQQLPNGEYYGEYDSGKVVIPTIDGEPPLVNHEGARVHLQNIEALQTTGDDELLIQHIQSVYQDDLSLSRQLVPGTFPVQRPKSLAVPGMTTSSLLQEPQGPVMSISPQATYLSKIIPNAVMPTAIDIIEINHGHCQHSVSTISKSSLAGSPASSRSGGRTSEGPPTTSPSESYSQSSETIMSNSSTISSKGRRRPTCITDSTKKVSDLNPKDICVTSSKTFKCPDSTSTNQRLEHRESSDTEENVRNSCSRSLSVMKTKLPPAPPQRTYSLHHEKIKQRSKEWVDIKDFKDMVQKDGQTSWDLSSAKEDHSTNNKKKSVQSLVPISSRCSQSSLKSSPVSPDQAFTESQTGSSSSSPQKITSSENKFDRTLSPSSGYSSQSGTPTHSPKEASPSSPGNRRVKPSKPERAGARTSPEVSVSSSMTSLFSVTLDTAHQDIQTNTTPSDSLKPFPAVTIVQNKVTSPHPTITLRDLFNIPPPPKVKAPSPPPPETWTHNKCVFELLCGPGPNAYRLHQLQKQQKETLIGKTQNTETIPNVEQMISNIQTSEEINHGSHLEKKEAILKEQKEAVLPQEHEQMMVEPPALRLNESSILHNEENEQQSPKIYEKNFSQNIHTQDPRNVEDQKEQGGQTIPKRKLPTIEVDQSMLSQTNCEADTGAEFVSKTSTPKCYRTEADNQRNCIVKVIPNHKAMQTLGIEVPEANGISPSPSPPPEHHPPPPPTKQSLVSLVSSPVPDKEEHRQETEAEATYLESSWPPPPPMDEIADLMFEEQEELEFPPPPPLIIHEASGNCHEESEESFEQVKLTKFSDMANSPEQNSEIHTILLTRTVQNCTVMDGRQHDKPKSCTDGTDTTADPPKMSAPSQGDLLQIEKELSTKPIVSTEVSSKQASPESSNVPPAPPLPVDDQSTVNFRKQLSLVNKENKSKELLCRHKSTPITKEDANIPLVTPSLLQMVRLRSVNVEDQVNDDDKSSTDAITYKDQQNFSQATPQKPIRKSLSLKSNPLNTSSSTTVTAPSMCLQEAIRMKTAALSSSGVPAMLNLRLPSAGSTNSQLPKTPEGCELHRSPASTASFIFSKSTKKVIETPTSPRTQPAPSHNLVAEITQVSDQAKIMITNGTKKPIKVPPPVAKKPVHGTNPHNKPEKITDKTECLTNKQIVRVNGRSDAVHPAGQRAQVSASQDKTRSTETAC